jgi:lysozyme
MARVLIALACGFVAWRVYMLSTPESGAADVLKAETALFGAIIMGTPASNMELSASGLEAIADREGFAPKKYVDATGFSIGYGHFIKAGEFFNEPMPEWRARELLLADSAIASDAVRAYVKVPITQNQFDSLVSFTFNVGVGAFKKSTLLARLNAGDYVGAAAQFDRWHIPAIVAARRDSEKRQFLA